MGWKERCRRLGEGGGCGEEGYGRKGIRGREFWWGGSATTDAAGKGHVAKWVMKKLKPEYFEAKKLSTLDKYQ